MNKLVVEVSAADLPAAISRQLPGGRAVPGGRYRVTVEDVDDVAKLAALRADLNAGREQLRAGLGIDAETVFAELEADDRDDSRQR